MHLIDGPKALDRGVQEACVTDVAHSPSRWLWGRICCHLSLGILERLWLGLLLKSGISPGFSFWAGGQDWRRGSGANSRRMVVEVGYGFKEGVGGRALQWCYQSFFFPLLEFGSFP